jgi:hypothetical protein
MKDFVQNFAKILVYQVAYFICSRIFFCPKPVGKSSLESPTQTLTLHEGFRRILIKKNFAKNTSFTKGLILFAVGFFLSQAGRKI